MWSSVKWVKVSEEHPCNFSYHLPLIASIEMRAVTSHDELINNSEKEYERIAWMKFTSEQVSEYQRRLYESIIGIDDNTLYSRDDVENYYRFICRSVKFSDECLPRVRYKKFVKPYWNNELKRPKTTCMELYGVEMS